MDEKSLFKLHPISVQWVFPKELSIKAHVPPSSEVGLKEFPYSLAVGYGKYDEKKKIVTIALKLETVENEDQKEQLPYSLKIELLAAFKVDEQRFEIKYIEDWARRNAPFILYPYLREHAYALTLRCGFEPLMLPLVEVPTSKVKSPRKKRSSSKTSSKKASQKKPRA